MFNIQYLFKNMFPRLIFFIFCVRSFALSATTTEQPLSFEIKRHTTGWEHLLKNGHQFPQFKKHFENSPRDNDSIALYRFLDDEFYGQIIIGHPAQIFNVNFDTSWGVSWIMSSKCSSIKEIGCFFHNTYDHKKSSEYKPDGRPFNFNTGNYTMKGFYSYDNISIAHSNVTNQSFVELTEVPNEFLFNKADGVMGLGLKSNDNYVPFFYTLLKQGKIKNPVFSIYLNRDKQSNRGGNVILGFIDPRHIHHEIIDKVKVYDNITYLAVDNSAYWQFKMDQVVVNVKDDTFSVCQGGCNAIVDTSSNSIYGPSEEIDRIHDAINARDFFLHRYTVDCDTINKLPKIDFILNGKNFTLSGQDYTVKMSWHSITLCLSAFVPANTVQEQNLWTLGAAFLSEFYSVYNVEERTIGFVRSS